MCRVHKHTSISPTLLGFFFLTLHAFLYAEVGSEAPERKALVQLNDTPYEVVIGETATVPIGNQEYQLKVELLDHSVFNKAGMRFDFGSNRNYLYEKLDGSVDHWTLEGSSSTIMIQRYDSWVSDKDIFDAFRDQYQSMKASIETAPIELEAPDTVLTGSLWSITMGEVLLHQEIYYLKGMKPRVLILQDMMSVDGSSTAEFLEMRRLLRASLKLQ